MENVRLVDPDRANLLALFLRSILERRLEARAVPTAPGEVLLEAGRMRARLSFRAGEVVIDPAPGDEPWSIRVRGTLGALLDLCLGRRLVRHLVTGAVEAEGNPYRLLVLMRLLRA